jgi:hypothetical protein
MQPLTDSGNVFLKLCIHGEHCRPKIVEQTLFANKVRHVRSPKHAKHCLPNIVRQYWTCLISADNVRRIWVMPNIDVVMTCAMTLSTDKMLWSELHDANGFCSPCAGFGGQYSPSTHTLKWLINGFCSLCVGSAGFCSQVHQKCKKFATQCYYNHFVGKLLSSTF